MLIERIEEAKRVAAADVDRVGVGDGVARIGAAVDADQLVAGVQAALGHDAQVLVVIVQGIGNEQHLGDRAEVRDEPAAQIGDALLGAKAAAAEQDAHDFPPASRAA